MKDHAHGNCQMFLRKTFGLTRVRPFVYQLITLNVLENISHDITVSCKLIFSHHLLRSKPIKTDLNPLGVFL